MDEDEDPPFEVDVDFCFPCGERGRVQGQLHKATEKLGAGQAEALAGYSVIFRPFDREAPLKLESTDFGGAGLDDDDEFGPDLDEADDLADAGVEL